MFQTCTLVLPSSHLTKWITVVTHIFLFRSQRAYVSLRLAMVKPFCFVLLFVVCTAKQVLFLLHVRLDVSFADDLSAL